MVVLSVRGRSLFPLFFLTFFALRNFEFPTKIKKGGGRTHRTPFFSGNITSNNPVHNFFKASVKVGRIVNGKENTRLQCCEV
jgi:hypothetical protein